MFEEGKTCIRIDPNLKNTIIIDGQNQQEQKFFSFDNVAGQEAEQEDIFEMIGEQQATNCIEGTITILSGYNGCVFVYGQTGSGKTYTMTGTAQQPGLLPRVIDYLFKCVFDDQMKDNSVEYLVKCSHLEIYNEHIIDLLNPDLGNLQLREDLNKGVYVEFLTEECCANLVEAMEVLQRGNENRHISSTQMNFESSRSHSVFTIQLESRRQSHSLTNHRFSRFHFVDLAGSERQKHTQVQGDRLREGCQINRSLHILGNVINSLVEDKEQSRYVHYRDSKLTFLLKDSLGGNSRTHLIATIQQSNLFYQETLSTLMFSKRVKQVKNKARVNEDESGSLESLKNEIKRLKQELAKWIVGLQSTHKSAESPDKKNIMMHNLNFDDLTANDQRYIKLEEILKVYLEQSTESETALYVEIEKYLSGIKELREAFSLSSQLEQQLKLIIRLQNEQIIRLKHANGCEDLSSDYDSELAKALLSQAAVMKKFSDSLKLKEGSAITVEKAKLQINENVQLLNTIVATVNSSLEERKKFQKQIEQQFTQVYVPIEEFNQLVSEQSNIKQQLTQAQEKEQLIRQNLDQIGITIDEGEQFKIIDHKQRDLSLEQLSEQLEVKSRAAEQLNQLLSDQQAIVSETKEQNIILTQQIEQIKKALENSENQQNQQQSQQIEYYIKENESLKQQNHEQNKQNNILTNQISDLQQEQQLLLFQIEELKQLYQEANENFQLQQQALQDQITDQQNKEKETLSIQEQLKKQIQTIIDAHDKEINTIKEDFEYLLSNQQTNYELQIQQITEDHQKQIEEQKVNLESDHKLNLEELKNQLQKNYQIQLSEQQQLREQQNEQQIEKLQCALQTKFEELEEQLKIASLEQQQQTKARLEIQKEVQKLQLQITNESSGRQELFEERYEALEEEINENKIILDKRNKEVHYLQQQIVSVQENFQQEKQVLEEKCEIMQEKINENEMMLENKDKEVNYLQQQLLTVQEIAQKEQQILEDQCEIMQQKINEYEMTVEEKINQVNQLQQQIIMVQQTEAKQKMIMEDKCESLQKQVDQLQMNIEEKIYEFEQISEQLKQLEEITTNQSLKYEEVIQQKQSEIEELQLQINQLDIECIQTKQKVKQDSQLHEQELQKACEKLNKELELKNEELNENQQIIQELISKKNKELEDLTIKYNSQHEVMENKLKEVHQVVEQKQKEVEYFELQAIPENQELQGQLEQKEYELQMQNEDFMKQQNILFDIITNKDNELNKLQDELNDYTERLKEASNVIEQYSACNSDLKSNIDHLHQQIEKQQQLIHEFQGKAKEQHISTQVYEEKVKSLNEILKSKQNEVENLQVLLSEGSQNENEIQSQNQQMSLKLQMTEKKLKDLENENQELTSQLSSAQEEHETTIEQFQTKIKQKEKEKGQLNQTLKDLQDQIVASNSNVEEQKIWVMHYKKEVSKLTKEVTLQQQIHQQQVKESENLKNELSQLSKKYEQVQSSNQQLKREIEQLQQNTKELQQLKSQFEAQIQQYEEQEIEMRQIQSERQILQNKVNEINKSLNQQHQESNKIIDSQQEELQNVKKELSEIKQKNKQLQQQYQNDLENLNLQIQVVQEELESSKVDQQEVKKHEQELKEANIQMRANLERLKVDNTQKKNEIHSLQNELDYSKQELQIKEENTFKLQEQLKYKQQQLDSQATMMNQIEQNKLNQTNQILQQSNQLTNLSKEIFSLKQQLQINETQTESYKREVERLRRELEFHVKQVEDYKSQNKTITQQLDFEKKNQTKQRVFDAAELLSKIDSTLSPIKGSKVQLYGSSDSKTQKRVFQQKTPQKEYGFQNSNSSSVLNTSFQTQDQLAKENRKLKASLDQKMKIIEQLEQAIIQSEETLKEVHEKANQFCQQQEEEIRQIKDQYQKLEQEHNAILAEREYENQQINQQKQQALFKVQILQDEVLKSKRGSVGSQHISGNKYIETVQDMSLREPPSSSHRYRQSEGSFKSYFGAEAHSLLMYDTQKLLLENQKLNGYMCKLYQILGLDKNRSNKLNDGDKIIQSVQLLLQEIIDCKQEIQNLVQAQPSRSLKYQSMEKELMETKQKYYAVERSPKFWNPRTDTPKAKFFNYSNSTGK